MDIEFIKSEFEKLTLILRPWKEGQNISTIERDIVLDKLKNIYDAVRFTDLTNTHTEVKSEVGQSAAAQQTETAAAEQTTAKQTIAAAMNMATKSAANENADSDEEDDDVEVELIFSEEDEEMSLYAPETTSAESHIEEIITTPAPAPTPVPTPAAVPVATAVPTQETTVYAETTTAAQVTVAAQPQANAATWQAPATEVNTPGITEETPRSNETVHTVPAAKAEPAQYTTRHTMNSLFGNDELRHRHSSRHHRMMSIYDDDTESTQEKVVSISNIFESEDYAPDAKYSSDRYDTDDYPPIASQESTPSRKSTENHPAEEPVPTIADAMTGSKQTLADTLPSPAHLAEQITHNATHSLQNAIGINDRFLLINDLFDGDDCEYDKAINELDSFDNLDDCIIYIAENFAWNPNSDGAKLIMQLLERKLS